MTSVTSSSTAARSTTTLTLAFSTGAVTANTLNYIGVELPWGWGNVMTNGATSYGAATVTN